MKNKQEVITKKISSAREKKIDETLGLQIISIRLQKDLIASLKALSKNAGIGYQPYIRQLLTHHVNERKKGNIKIVG